MYFLSQNRFPVERQLSLFHCLFLWCFLWFLNCGCECQHVEDIRPEWRVQPCTSLMWLEMLPRHRLVNDWCVRGQTALSECPPVFGQSLDLMNASTDVWRWSISPSARRRLQGNGPRRRRFDAPSDHVTRDIKVHVPYVLSTRYLFNVSKVSKFFLSFKDIAVRNPLLLIFLKSTNLMRYQEQQLAVNYE